MADPLHPRSHTGARGNAPGSVPGLVKAHKGAVPLRLDIIAYGPDGAMRERDVSVARVIELRAQQAAPAPELDGVSWPVLWVDIVGLGDIDILRGLGDIFQLHSLVLEDILHVAQRPKLEEYEDYNFIVARMVADDQRATTEQLAIVQFRNCILTFQERPGDSLEPVRERIARNLGRVRASGADYLAYSVLDAVIDHYAPVLDFMSERIEDVEHAILTNPETSLLSEVYDLKHSVLSLRRLLSPMRDAIGQLHREEVQLFSAQVDPYLRDCYDHAVRLIENLEVIRESASVLMDLYMSSVSFHMNEVVKVLTIISTIFIPLSFIVGLYGMNFDTGVSDLNMPELSWRYGYVFCLGIMGAITVTLLLYFRRKGWMRSENMTERLPKRSSR